MTIAAAGVFDHGNGLADAYTPATTAPAPDCKGLDGWWRCLNDSAQATIVAAIIIALALILGAIILRVRRKK